MSVATIVFVFVSRKLPLLDVTFFNCARRVELVRKKKKRTKKEEGNVAGTFHLRVINIAEPVGDLNVGGEKRGGKSKRVKENRFMSNRDERRGFNARRNE